MVYKHLVFYINYPIVVEIWKKNYPQPSYLFQYFTSYWFIITQNIAHDMWHLKWWFIIDSKNAQVGEFSSWVSDLTFIHTIFS
jgi:hypothetical protein